MDPLCTFSNFAFFFLRRKCFVFRLLCCYFKSWNRGLCYFESLFQPSFFYPVITEVLELSLILLFDNSKIFFVSQES